MTNNCVFPEKFIADMAEYGYTVEVADGSKAGTAWVMISRGPLCCTCEISEKKLKSETELLDALKTSVLVKAGEYAETNNTLEETRNGFLEWQITLLNDLHFISGDAIIHVLSGTIEITGKINHDAPADSRTPRWMKAWLDSPES